MIQEIILSHELIDLLTNAGICTHDEVSGCSFEEIKALEEAASLSLPLQYREFLLGIGKGAGGFLAGTDIFFPTRFNLKDAAVDLLSENNTPFNLPKDAFVFSMHQGYEFSYFLTSDGDNPAIFQYVEGNNSPALGWKSFSSFMRDSINSHISHITNRHL